MKAAFLSLLLLACPVWADALFVTASPSSVWEPTPDTMIFDGLEYTLSACGNCQSPDVSTCTTNNTTLAGQGTPNTWWGGKADNIDGGSGCDDGDNGKFEITTTASIPGESAPLPGLNSSTIGLWTAAADGFQTSQYLLFGDGSDGDTGLDTEDVWFQFWIYAPSDGALNGTWPGTNKWIYPCWNGVPTCVDADWDYFINLGPIGGEPNCTANSTTTGGLQLLVELNRTALNWNYSGTPCGSDWRIGHTTEAYIARDEWTLVKINMQTSISPGTNRIRAWIRPYNGSWTKVMHWEEGNPPEVIQFDGGNEGDIDSVQFTSTFPKTSTPGVEDPLTFYIDDIAMANDDSGLPDYDDLSGVDLP